ncbi:MAG TPA: PKD domain-containing protein [Methanotrichaceae archaeon]|nr:PKD domain-containing protein [Methanotrichaceae archaeon]HQF17625.1 PKD domain-containing protein [Methanotrichaceae archaeon]HQI92213.1 PKD domain-containing protein [Methanotrichaceae archaeon]
MRLYFIIGIALLISIYPSLCTEIAYIFGADGEKASGQANLTDYSSDDIVSFTVSDSPRGPSTSYKAVRRLDSIMEEINQKVDRGNDLVRDQGLRLIRDRSGPQRIDQICSIYDYMVDNWTFASDWRGLEQFQYSNYTLRKGMEFGTSGKGDCDDFSILLASLIEAIGGTPRVVFAYGQGGGHAYAEVYLGRRNDSDVNRMLAWLRSEYDADINYHVDSKNEDVWLNMDWWKDPGGANHPGGPFYQATDHIPIYIQEDLPKTPLTSIANQLPIPAFIHSPQEPAVGDVVSFNASASHDLDGRIVDYQWDFGDGDTAHGMLKSKSPHIYSYSGLFPVNLTITDNDGDSCTSTAYVNVTEPLPDAMGTFSPAEPAVSEIITFDGSKSRDRYGRIISYQWDFDDGYTGNRASIKHQFLESGTYNVKLTVENEKGKRNTSTIIVVVKSKSETHEVESDASKTPLASTFPSAAFIYTPAQPKVGDVISFDASASGDQDGNIVDYEWDFGDGNTAHGSRSVSPHIYTSSGKFRVNLTVTDDQGSKRTKTVYIDVIESLPVAIPICYPAEPTVSDIVTFDGSRSLDKNGRIVSYEWDFDDGYKANRASIKHQFLESGTYNVKLTVENDKGMKNASMIVVSVRPRNQPAAAQEVAPAQVMPEIPVETESPISMGSPYPQQSSGSLAQDAIPSSGDMIIYDAWPWQAEATSGSISANASVSENESTAMPAYSVPATTYVFGATNASEEGLFVGNATISASPSNAQTYNTRGMELASSNEYGQAIEAFDTAISMNPSYATAWYNKGMALNLLARYEEAVECLDEAIRLDPSDREAWNQRGIALMSLGRSSEADDAFKRSRELGNPSAGIAYISFKY